jgi:polar amino acid transport system substrate-binding protein
MKKIFIYIIYISLLFSLSSCEGKNEGVLFSRKINNNLYGFTNHSSIKQSILDIIQNTKTIRVGYSKEIKPLFYIDDESNKGYIIDLVKEITKELVVYYEFIKSTEEELLNSLLFNKIDIAIFSNPNSIEREYIIDYSIPYLMGGIKLLTYSPDDIQNLDDLTGKTISILSNSTFEDKIREPLNDIYIYKVENINQIENLLKDNVIEAYAGKTVDLIQIMNTAKNPDKLNIINHKINDIPYSFGLPENDSNWMDYINIKILDIHQSGKLKTLFQKYFDNNSLYSLHMDWSYTPIYNDRN